MNDTISRQALLNKFEPWLKVKDYSDGELNMLKAILHEIRFTPPVGTNLAEVGTDCISRQAAIDALDKLCDRECEYSKKQRSVMCGACHLGSAFDVIDSQGGKK